MEQRNMLLASQKPHKKLTTSQEARCHCGYLVAKLRKEGVELKCRRCKRIIVLPFHISGMEEHIFEPCPCP